MGRGVKLPKTHGDIFGGAPTPIMPTENIGIMSGAIRKKRGDKKEERGSRRAGIFGGSSVAQVTMRDPKTGRMYGLNPIKVFKSNGHHPPHECKGSSKDYCKADKVD